MRRGVRLGIDPGQVRIGVAASDPDGVLAVPVETVSRGAGDLDRIGALVDERAVLEVLVGLPRSLSGAEGAAAHAARQFARDLAEAVPVDVRLVDERMSTAAATRSLRASGRDSRSSRAVIDQAAAVVLLQSALDSERVSGRPPGERVRRSGVPSATPEADEPGSPVAP
ncbi:MAG: Holliday junction resolvase RuvX [Actinomycetes bacterium]